MKKNVFQIQKKSANTWRDSRKDIGRSLDLEMKRNIMEIASASPKESGIPEQHKCYNDSRRKDIQFFSGVSSLSRGVLKRRKNKDTIYFTAETWNVELLLRIIHSANQLSIYGAVSSWSGHPSPNETDGEVRHKWRIRQHGNAEECAFTGNKLFGGFCLVKTRLWKQGARWSSGLFFTRTILDCEDLWNSIILEYCWESDVLQHSSRHGWWCWRFHTSMQRIFTTSTRSRFNSSWCNSRTVVGPVLQFIVVRIMGTYRNEIEILSLEQTSTIMFCRRMNRYMDKALVQKAEYTNSSRELITERAVEAIGPCSTKWGQSRTEETRDEESESWRSSVVHSKHICHQTVEVGNCSWV